MHNMIKKKDKNTLADGEKGTVPMNDVRKLVSKETQEFPEEREDVNVEREF